VALRKFRVNLGAISFNRSPYAVRFFPLAVHESIERSEAEANDFHNRKCRARIRLFEENSAIADSVSGQSESFIKAVKFIEQIHYLADSNDVWLIMMEEPATAVKTNIESML
jgi:hypothetical protein